MSGSALWGGNAFVGVQARHGWRPSARASFVSGFSSGPVPDLSLRLLAARFEGCPAAWGAALSVMGCVALDLGSLRASSSAPGGTSDTSFWSALWGLARVQYLPAGSSFGAEMQGGLTTALTRYRVTAGTPPESFAEVRPWGVGLAVGAVARWP